MKYLMALMFLFSAQVFAECKVYGISDSPQKLHCDLGTKKIDLTCKNKDYYLNSEKVILAFHMEVEEGATPLVFKTNSGKTLTVVPEDVILAEYQDAKEYLQGSCTK